jgi:rhodanese-related sulfurtransferase
MKPKIGLDKERKSIKKISGKVPASKKKQTTLGLYVTAKEAYEIWKTNPQGIHILDVRSLQEYVFVGHAEMAINIPLVFAEGEWDEKKEEVVVKPNSNFVSQVKLLFKPNDTILVMCRSGGRAAAAVNMLAQAGFKNVYNIVDSMEGDKVDNPENVFHGKRMKNGWKNSGLPWTYDVDPKLLSPKLPTS